MKRMSLIFAGMMMSLGAWGKEWTDAETGISWLYLVDGDVVSIDPDGADGRALAAINIQTSGAIEIPIEIEEKKVVNIGSSAFYMCRELTSVTIPSSVTNIGTAAFRSCSSLTSITIPSGVERIGINAFCNCNALVSVTITKGVKMIDASAFYSCDSLASVTLPSSVTDIGATAFRDCSSMVSVAIPSSVTNIGANAFSGCDALRTVYVDRGDAERIKSMYAWPVGVVIKVEGEPDPREQGVTTLVITNVVIHYIVNSIQPERVIPATMDTGFVNVITEVKSGGVVSVPETWNQNYPDFATRFGSDFTKALMKQTNKRDGSGNPMYVWQDYVAGTDPTKDDDVFKASVTMVEGNPVVSYTPELTEAEKALRKYTTWGKSRLQDENWVEVHEGHEGDYNFFKVTVEMK